MNKQITLSAITDELGQATTRKKEFLGQIDRIIPWSEWIGIIEPHYYKGERGNKPYDLEVMLRIHLVQNLYNLSDMSTMTEVIDSRAFSEFCGVDSSNQVPDGDTIGRFRALLIEHGLQEKLFEQVVNLLSVQGLINLRLDDPDLATQRFRRLDRLIDALTEDAARDNHAELFEKFFSLIFVNIHLPSLLECK